MSLISQAVKFCRFRSPIYNTTQVQENKRGRLFQHALKERETVGRFGNGSSVGLMRRLWPSSC